MTAKKKEIILIFYILLHNFIWFRNCPAYADIKQTTEHWRGNRVNIHRETFIFYTCFLMFVFCFFSGQSFLVVVLDRFFSVRRQKNWWLVALNRWSSYTVMIVWGFTGADLALVVLAERLSYRGGRLNRFDCNALS